MIRVEKFQEQAIPKNGLPVPARKRSTRLLAYTRRTLPLEDEKAAPLLLGTSVASATAAVVAGIMVSQF